jgi:hypothetical protein
MGTNYYVKTKRKVVYKGFDVSEILHVGKSSCGWYFALHIIPELGINTLQDWIPYLMGGEIHNEYGEYIPYAVMMDTILRNGDPALGHWGMSVDTEHEPHTLKDNICSCPTYYGENGLLYAIDDTHNFKRVLPIPTDIKGLYTYTIGDFS